LSGLIFPLFGPLGTLALVAIGAIAALIRGGEGSLWRAGGLIYFGLVVMATLAVRGSAPIGILAGVFLGTVVWLTDTGAFFTGRQVGGEKLAPEISPSKTWSGAIGGLALGTICGFLLWIVFTPSPWWIGLGFAAVMSVLGQLGDLTESALKRRFRIKDSGDIIPGHGGLMDRLDSLTFPVLFMFAVGALHLGTGSAASGFLSW
jgi:phosphatidate cytidylyltransferase